MFRDTKRRQMRNRVLFSAAGACVLIFGMWLNFQGKEEDPQVEDTAQNIRVEQRHDDGSDEQTYDGTGQQEKEETSEKVVETYLIKEVDGVVKVFICDDTGKKELYLITSIPFDLLSESDQKLFTEGVKLDTEEDLGKFLESFDS